MHYYKRNLGDYSKKAGRLTMLQHGSYTLLIDACYDREQFPTLEEAIEWSWASTAEEIEAVTFVLKKFFTLDGDVYIQKRIQEEIAEYHGKSEINKRIANEREAKRRENSTKRAQVVNESPPNQEPITNNHKPVKSKAESAPASRLPADWVPSESDIEFCKTERPDLQASVVADNFRDYWIAKPGADGKKVDWSATWRNWVRKERAQPQARSLPERQSRHAGFAQLDYSEGVTEDGRIA